MAGDACAGCGATRSRILFEAADSDTGTERFSLLRCEECDLVRTAPALTPAELGRYYSDAYYGTPGRKFMPLAEHGVGYATRLRARRLARRLRRHDPAATRVLDIGCGRGLLLKCLAGDGYRCFGTEIGECRVAPHSGVRVWIGGVEALDPRKASFELVSICHVLEHMENPRMVLEACSRVLKPGGVLAIDVPNFSSWQASLFREYWLHLDLPRHRFHFTRTCLERLLADCGFETTTVSTSSWVQNPYGFLQSALNAIFRNRPPNLLYQLIKQGRASGRLPGGLRITAELLAAVVLAPAGLLENVIATMCGRGATLSVVAVRR